MSERRRTKCEYVPRQRDGGVAGRSTSSPPPDQRQPQECNESRRVCHRRPGAAQQGATTGSTGATEGGSPAPRSAARRERIAGDERGDGRGRRGRIDGQAVGVGGMGHDRQRRAGDVVGPERGGGRAQPHHVLEGQPGVDGQVVNRPCDLVAHLARRPAEPVQPGQGRRHDRALVLNPAEVRIRVLLPGPVWSEDLEPAAADQGQRLLAVEGDAAGLFHQQARGRVPHGGVDPHVDAADPVDQGDEPAEVDLHHVVERDADLLLDRPDQRRQVARQAAHRGRGAGRVTHHQVAGQRQQREPPGRRVEPGQHDRVDPGAGHAVRARPVRADDQHRHRLAVLHRRGARHLDPLDVAGAPHRRAVQPRGAGDHHGHRGARAARQAPAAALVRPSHDAPPERGVERGRPGVIERLEHGVPPRGRSAGGGRGGRAAPAGWRGRGARAA